MSKPALAQGGAFDFEMPKYIQDAFRQSIMARPDGKFIFTGTGGSESEATYLTLWNTALATLGGLKKAKCKAGNVIILDASDIANFIPALWAVMLGGMVAAPIARSSWNASAANEFKEKLASLSARLNHPTILSNSPEFDTKPSRRLEYKALATSRKVMDIAATDRELPAALIATSGTTGHPQLVTLSARAIMHRWWPSNPAAHSETRYLGWTPLDHVMGLGFAAPNYQQKIYLPADIFVREPQRWLDLIERHRVTHSVMTNFGMNLLNERLKKKSTWDLTSLTRIGVGAEMIAPKTCHEFVTNLIPFGMKKDAVILGYGLSECGPVAGGKQSYIPSANEEPLLIDLPTSGHEIRIVSDHGPCMEKQAGRIEVRGPTMTSGYHNDDTANAELFTQDGWLRTGDLGYLENGALCVTGREKETLSINAKKFSCHEIDAALQKASGATFVHVFANGDHVNLIYAAPASPAAEAKIRKACVLKFGFGPAHMAACAFGELPRTSSGKLQRHKLHALLKPEKPAPKAAPAKDMESQLAHIMSRFLGGNIPKPTDNFFEIGGDSLAALMFTVAVESELGINLPPAIFAKSPSCKAIAHYLKNDASDARSISLIPVQKGKNAIGLFLAPGIWGNNAYATQMAADLAAPNLPIWTFHLPSNTEGIHSLTAIAVACARLMQKAQPKGPYHLAGHSFGGLLAFEMARHLISQGYIVATLSIIDSHPLGRFEMEQDMEAGGLSIHHYRRLMRSYFAEPLDCKIHYYRALHSPYLNYSDPTAGWSYLATKGVEIFDIPGDHHSIMRGAARQKISQHLKQSMLGKSWGRYVPGVKISAKARAYIEAARKASYTGKDAQEISALAHAITADKNVPFWVHADLAAALFKAGRAEQAEKAYHAALSRDPWPLNTYKRFAGILREHDLKNSGRAMMAALDTLPTDSVAAAYAKAKICLHVGDINSVIHFLKAGLEITPNSADLRFMLAELCHKQGLMNEARTQISHAIDHPIENDMAFLRLGNLAIKLKDHDLAKRCLTYSLSINPTNPDTVRLLQNYR